MIRVGGCSRELAAENTLVSSHSLEEIAMPARKRELIEPHKGDKRYVRRNAKGRFKEVDDVGRSLAQDRRRKATRPGQGDRGDRRPRAH